MRAASLRQERGRGERPADWPFGRLASDSLAVSAAAARKRGAVQWRQAVLLLAAILIALGFAFGTAPAFADNEVNTGQLPDGSFIYEAKISDLSANSTYYDNQTVQVTGEVVGDRIREEGDSSRCWITLSALWGEDAGTVQVLVSNTQADLIDSYGRYGVTGSKVRVMGTFHANCGSHEGLEDIHASDLSEETAGQSSPDELNMHKLVGALTLVAAGAVLLLLYRNYRARSR
jgi:hypothetical protein